MAIRSGLPPLVRTNRYNRHDGFGTRCFVTRCGRIRMIRVSLCEARRRRRHGGRMIGPIKMHRASSRPSILPHCGTHCLSSRVIADQSLAHLHTVALNHHRNARRKRFRVVASRWSSSPFRPRRGKRKDTRPILRIYREDVDEGAATEGMRKSFFFVDF